MLRRRAAADADQSNVWADFPPKQGEPWLGEAGGARPALQGKDEE